MTWQGSRGGARWGAQSWLEGGSSSTEETTARRSLSADLEPSGTPQLTPPRRVWHPGDFCKMPPTVSLSPPRGCFGWGGCGYGPTAAVPCGRKCRGPRRRCRKRGSRGERLHPQNAGQPSRDSPAGGLGRQQVPPRPIVGTPKCPPAGAVPSRSRGCWGRSRALGSLPDGERGQHPDGGGTPTPNWGGIAQTCTNSPPPARKCSTQPAASVDPTWRSPPGFWGSCFGSPRPWGPLCSPSSGHHQLWGRGGHRGLGPKVLSRGGPQQTPKQVSDTPLPIHPTQPSPRGPHSQNPHEQGLSPAPPVHTSAKWTRGGGRHPRTPSTGPNPAVHVHDGNQAPGFHTPLCVTSTGTRCHRTHALLRVASVGTRHQRGPQHQEPGGCVGAVGAFRALQPGATRLPAAGTATTGTQHLPVLSSKRARRISRRKGAHTARAAGRTGRWGPTGIGVLGNLGAARGSGGVPMTMVARNSS